MRVLTRAVALGSSTRMLWLLQATSSRTRVPCALCHSAASQAPQVPQVRYAELAQTLDSIEQADARLAKEELMAKLLERACREAPSDMTLCVALTSLQLSPGMRPSKLGIGDALILSALSEASGTPVATLKAELTQVGDLGIVSVDNLGEPPAGGAPLTLSEVHATLLELAVQSGDGSSTRKAQMLSEMMVRATPLEAKFIVRSIRGKTRTGLGDRSLRAALAQAGAALVDDPSPELAEAMGNEAETAALALALAEGVPAAEKKAQRAATAARKAVDKVRGQRRRRAVELVDAVFQVQPCYHQLVDALLAGGVWSLDVTAKPGMPLQPMTAAPVNSVAGVLKRFGAERPFLAERKYDGERCQLHLLPPQADGSSRVRLYSRSNDEVSVRFPEIVELLPACLPGTTSAVIDAEVCAYDVERDAILPFQSLAARPRKAPTAEQAAATPLCVFAFDLLVHDGVGLLQTPLSERRRLLAEHVRPVKGRLALALGAEVADEAALEEQLALAVAESAEGLMCKALEGPEAAYQPGKRSLHWLKLKADYVDGMGDSLDLVPIGGYMGQGKRSGRFGAYLLACLDPTSGRWQPVCKLGSGFSDDDLAAWHATFAAEAPPRAEPQGGAQPLPEWLELPAGGLPPSLQPHTWLEPKHVWEVKGAALSLSPWMSAALGRVVGEPTKGLALRFPRLVRVRPE